MKQISILFAIVLLVFGACKDSNQGSISFVGDNITEVILYQHDSTSDGALGGRTGANGLCQSSANRPFDRSNYIGFISIDTNDTIGNLPMNNGFPGDVTIKSKNGQIVANGWNDLMDGTINNTLFSLGVMDSSTDSWWSGGRNGGDPTSDTCNGFYSDSSSDSGVFGTANQSSSWWIENSPVQCNQDYRILCLAY